MTHWTPSRKLAVIKEHRNGASEVDIFVKYGVTAPELREWIAKDEKHGPQGLRVTYLDKYRGN